MTAAIILVVYLLLGALTAWLGRSQRRDGSLAIRLAAHGTALVLWPLFLPFQGPRPSAAPRWDETWVREIELRDQRLRQALGRARAATPGLDADRIARFTARFVRRLQRLDRRLRELGQASSDSPESVRGALEELREQTREELGQGLALLDELAGKLTLVAFADPGGAGSPGADPGELKALLQRLEDLACATREVGEVAAEVTA
jgi:hypothetical protein